MSDTTTQIACPYTAGGCPLFNTILPVDTPRCTGGCSPVPASPAPPRAASPPQQSAPAALAKSTTAIELPPLPDLTSSNSTTPDDSLWSAYLDYSFTPQPFNSAPYLFPGQELVPLTVAEGSGAGGCGGLGEKHGLIDIEELLMPKRTKVDYNSTAAVENVSAPPLPALDPLSFSSDEADDVEDDEPATPFISKLVYLLGHAEYQQYVRWDPQGKSVILAHAKHETLEVLTKFFRHTTVASFVRQLNIYGFKRLSTVQLLNVIDPAISPAFSAADLCAFTHPDFWRSTRGHHCPLGGLKPVHSKERAARTKKRASKADA
ncbi:HSF-type DNA-binding-domain-containing protein [Leucosporidium creatinivorum]|uniref:HSF-type DNA-binding-domain-containing protein n=1 Tax=Leucosporidium creatinivorum TaxID=106004 RepID=A0A1Y2G396_9BASI|nr:HSF-type DNA-binding-domain-containing protein [Leucosporidium creatinivorum]